MKMLIAGVDGYMGAAAMHYFALKDYHIVGVDNFWKRNILDSKNIHVVNYLSAHDRAEFLRQNYNKEVEILEGDFTCQDFTKKLISEFCPDVVIHFAEVASAPFSMESSRAAEFTISNNVLSTLSICEAVKGSNAHLIKVGTMGEYGTPNIDIEEGWLEVEHKGREEKFLYPRQASSLYHTSKIMDTDLIWFLVRNNGLRVTDLMQGPVFGSPISKDNWEDSLQSHLCYDDIFGTVFNRFFVQAISNIPLTIYGEGSQTRGYLSLNDAIRCIDLCIDNPPEKGEFKIRNQFTQVLTVSEIANLVSQSAKTLGFEGEVRHIINPRKEKEGHYYNPIAESYAKLGFVPSILDESYLIDQLTWLDNHRASFVLDQVMPSVTW